MSLSVEGQQCPVCKAYLFNDDDVVYCPVCGAPHHRDCYNSLGHCALEHLHGTDEQYKYEPKEEKAEPVNEEKEYEKCRFCGKDVEKDANFCPHCRAPRGVNFGPKPIILEGIKENSEIDGVTAKDMLNFVLINPAKYIKKFFEISKGKITSWNWGAFLFPCEWAFYRKNYKMGIINGILLLASGILLFPMERVFNEYGINSNSISAMPEIIESIEKTGALPIILFLLGTLFTVLISVISGIFADKIYCDNVVNKIKKIDSQGEEREMEFRKKGGANIFFFLASYVVRTYILQILAMILL